MENEYMKMAVKGAKMVKTKKKTKTTMKKCKECGAMCEAGKCKKCGKKC
jgi:hypothetical protein